MSESEAALTAFSGDVGSIPPIEPPQLTELQALLIGDNPRRQWGEYLRENQRRRSAGLPLGNFHRLVAGDENLWRHDMAMLRTATIDEGLSGMPMSSSQFNELQAFAREWEMGRLIPHRWGDEWVFTAADSVVPRFRIDMAALMFNPAQMSDMAIRFQRMMLEIGEEPEAFHPGHSPTLDIPGELEAGQQARRDGRYYLDGVQNDDLRFGMVGYPVILPGVEYDRKERLKQERREAKGDN
jgi:hypothetical protein